MKAKFEIQFLKEVFVFLEAIEEKARDKILYNLEKARFTRDKRLFKKLNAEIWEFRTVYRKKQYRLFAFWDKTDNKVTVVVATHGIIKKTQRIPKKEIAKATELMNTYLTSKNDQ